MQSTYLAQAPTVSLHSLLGNSGSSKQAPVLDLNWEPFQAHVEAFLNAVDRYTSMAKGEIAKRATEHTSQIRSLAAEKEAVERGIHLEKEREGHMLETLETERRTLANRNSALSHLQSDMSKLHEKSTSLEAELNTLRKEVKTERAEKERQVKVLDAMKGRDGVELGSLEDAVGWKVEGVENDLLLMRFTLIDPEDPDREFSILVDVSKQQYSVPKCSPPIPTLPELVAQLYDDRNFFGFIKQVRKAFRGLLPPPTKTRSIFDDLSGPGARNLNLDGLKIAESS
ncbi:hypothetical protein P7C73_g1111, partial [Tremellales sp. Uapishka_1]